MNSSLGCIRGDCSLTIRDDGSGSVTSCLHPGKCFTNLWLTRVLCQCHVIKIIITVSRLYIFNSFLDSYLSGIVFFFVRIFVVEHLHLNTSVCVFDTTSLILLDRTKVVTHHHLPNHLIRDKVVLLI
jgi:hypothetical protein